MKKLIAIFSSTLFLSSGLLSQNVGINTTNPEASLDVYGDVIFRTVTITADDGITYAFDINSTKSSYYRISGPTADFTLAGIIAGIDGRTITLFNRSGFSMQLNNEDPFAALTDQIVTGTSADLIIPNKAVINLQYDGIEEKWIVRSSSKGGGAGGGGYWDLSGSDIFNTTGGNVGIGTSVPTTKLTILTGTNTAGWTHIGQDGGGDPIIVGEGVGGVSAAIGTTTNHALRFNTNGTGKLSIYPGGEVVVGSNATGAYNNSKLTVSTLNNSYGIIHIGEGGNAIGTFIGGTSAGIGTYSNTNMRIFSNNVSAIFIAAGTANVGIGTDNPTYKLSVNGNIRSKEVVVESGWADYVFERSYLLRPIEELELFIRENKHLPNMPSAKEIEESGLHLGEIQKKMMEKIEELTLYIIQQQKEIDALKKAILSGNK